MSRSDGEEPETNLPTVEARAGVTGHNVRYVLGFGLAGIILAFIITVLAYS